VITDQSRTGRLHRGGGPFFAADMDHLVAGRTYQREMKMTIRRWTRICLIAQVGLMVGITPVSAEPPSLGSDGIRIETPENYRTDNQSGDHEELFGQSILIAGLADQTQPKKKTPAAQQTTVRQRRTDFHGPDQAFIDQNAKEPGVVVLPSGLQYRIIKEGNGRRPTLKDRVTIHYRGTLVNGHEISSSYRHGKPQTYDLAKVFPGLREGLLRMKEGARWQLVIPSNLTFGREGFLEDRVRIYDVELIRVLPAKP